MIRNDLRRGASLTTLALLVACGSDDGGSASAPAPNVLVKGSPSPADATCPGGGTKIDVGGDKNGNGQLDADEVTGSQVVCNPGVPTLTTVTPEGATTKCANGGVLVKSGPDTNLNNTLDDAEVKSTQEICTGGSSTSLSKSTPLAEGDLDCPFGGVRTQTGLDNGAGGGVAGDGVLQDGEIQTTSVSCVRGTAPFPGTTIAPAGAAGTSTIKTNGGTGLTSNGGNGGTLLFRVQGPSTGGGNFAWFKTGKADASFTFVPLTPTFGATKLDVAANKVLPVYVTPDAAADGDYYVLQGQPGLWFRAGVAAKQVAVTGVHVAANVTLTFPKEGLDFTLTNDFHNEGTITADVATNGNRGFVTMTVRQYFGAVGSKVALTGAPVAGQPGGAGGQFRVRAHRIANAGDIDTSGAAGDTDKNGGAGGAVTIWATQTPLSGPVENTGNVTSKGGAGKGLGPGGSGGFIVLQAAAEHVFTKGTMDASGGANGGNSGGIRVLSDVGTSRVSGSWLARGADVDEATCGATCSGGNGGPLFVTGNGDVDVDADLFSTGGKAKGLPGGNGGNVQLSTSDAPDPNGLGVIRPAGSVRKSGGLDASGASGSSGGNGGQLFFLIATQTPAGQEWIAFGQQGFESIGGNGASAGGNGGILDIQTSTAPGNVPSGGVRFHIPLTIRGGKATTSGKGGNGGFVQLSAGTPNIPAGSSQSVLLSGIDATGGDGMTQGGNGSPISVFARERLDVTGAITPSGGNASAANGAGGVAGPLALQSSTTIATSAVLSCKGGNGTGATSTGGQGGFITVRSGTITASAAIASTGGNGNGAAGGNASPVQVAGSAAPSKVTGVSSTGGTGTPAGANGPVVIDGMLQ